MSSPLPKLSYVLLSHNREKYIRAAIESAFAQEYEGELEYIFSDDCSTDNTYAIIQECVKAYTGNRRVVVTQTPHNCHLAGNTNHAVSFVESDWVVRADDDDYSCIDRCALIGRAIAEHPGCYYVTTEVKNFTDAEDEEALRTSRQACGNQAVFRKVDVRDTTCNVDLLFIAEYSYKAWHVDVYRQFGPLEKEAYYVDDLTCCRRASILGYGVYVDHAPAVLMRKGSGNMSRGEDDLARGYHAIMRMERFTDKYHNLTCSPLTREYERYRQYAQEHFSESEQQSLSRFFNSLEEDLEVRKLMCSYWRKGILNRWRIARRQHGATVFTMLRCLPLPLFAALLSIFRFFNDKRKKK